jgi:hypothetical protein
VSNREKEEEQLRMEELLRAARETKSVAPQLVKKARNLTEASQRAIDTATAVEDLAKNAPDGFFADPRFDVVIRGLREFNSAASTQTRRITADKSLLLFAQGNMTSTAVVSGYTALNFPVTAMAPAEPQLRALGLLIQRSSDVEAIRGAMTELGLHTPHGANQSAVQLLSSAEEALKRPHSDKGYAHAVLFPLREAIDETVAELLKRRKTPSKAKGWTAKIVSIGEELGNAAASQTYIARVAETASVLFDSLSGSKKLEMGREDIVGLFNQGLAVLRDICSLVDPKKLRA